jgi:hypothetical protein
MPRALGLPESRMTAPSRSRDEVRSLIAAADPELLKLLDAARQRFDARLVRLALFAEDGTPVFGQPTQARKTA